MASRKDFDTCDVCGLIRVAPAIAVHRKNKHGLVVAQLGGL
jgi:hypothetical protein